MNPIIESFYNQISWANECTIVKIRGFDFVWTSQCLYLPCHWNNCEYSSFIVTEAASKLQLEPALLIGGNPSKADAERIYWEKTKRSILVTFVDPVAQIVQAECITRALDGMDWSRTVEAIAHGSTKPVWEWD